MRRRLDDLARPAIAPSILAANLARLGDEITRVEEAGADLLHIDIMDGHFVPNLAFGPRVVESVRSATELPLNAHLMVDAPERFLGPLAGAGADILTFHVETVVDPASLARRIHDLGCSAGAALDLEGPFEKLLAALAYVDLVLIMTVRAGFGGQRFLPEALPRVATARGHLRPHQRLAVDGGLDPTWAQRAVARGADILVAGTAVFRTPDYRAAIRALREGAVGDEASPGTR